LIIALLASIKEKVNSGKGKAEAEKNDLSRNSGILFIE